MIISELFYSIQGEGELTGIPSFFIRTSGCNLRCNWCDTDYASWNPVGSEMSIDEILSHSEIDKYSHIVLTGGEPMISKDINLLSNQLQQLGKHVTIETAGTISPDNIACDLASISPKMNNSTPDDRLSKAWQKRHERDRLNVEVLREWVDNYNYQFKFVITEEDDLREILDLLKQLNREIPSYKVLLMPEGITKEAIKEKEKIVLELCLKYKFRYCDRLQIALFGNKKGT